MTPSIDLLCQLTVEKQLFWETIDKLIVNESPYSQQFQHILPNKSFFTEFDSEIIIVLYGEVKDLFSDRIKKGYYLQTLIDNTIEKVNAPEVDVVKLHTLITILSDSSNT
ncbi:TPA: hypothetical protein TVW26_001807 [Streptococcus equi subsp. equi]|uniref:hypothetical protein n=1 Tax=Streptococcus equi TaxID=1336 RepID=UPI000657A8F1|nr:hypothetical protein [Streptococcus equi]MBT1199251.1 hypothetical protein [Streptococcus equi subsp. equi]MBT1201088.1 hypothetical protein [Streptococcus equi subsp. equi]MBT1211496.1 hypothetical protein [Streptococcus equi subsp. equi]MCD3432182.1 hypothetical protein [Streptococcus equi subsp. zooepidemicus]MCD3432215.1 hypothetical protein [Streptococcus equi subsp. zooepidemicus]